MVQAAFGASYYNRQPVARQYQAANDFSDFDFDRLTNLGVSGLGQLTGQLKTILPASGNVVTESGSGPVVNTKFGIRFLTLPLFLFWPSCLFFVPIFCDYYFSFSGAFPLQEYSMIPEGFRREFLPILKALVAVFEKDELNPDEANILLSLSRDLTNKLPTPVATGAIASY